MNHKEIETTARNPSVGADGGQPSKTYTPISEDTADRFRSDLSLKPRRATMRDGCDGVFGGGSFTVAPSRRGKGGSGRTSGTREKPSLKSSCDIKHKSCKKGVNSVIKTKRKNPAIVIPGGRQWTV